MSDARPQAENVQIPSRTAAAFVTVRGAAGDSAATASGMVPGGTRTGPHLPRRNHQLHRG